MLYELLNTLARRHRAHDGTPIVMAMCHFTPGTPVEIIESEYPLRVRAFELMPDSAGAGRYRGGIGYAREFEMLEDSVLTVRSANHRFTAWGPRAAARRAPRASSSIPAAPAREELGPIETRALKAGDVIRFERSGGGGYGAARRAQRRGGAQRRRATAMSAPRPRRRCMASSGDYRRSRTSG